MAVDIRGLAVQAARMAGLGYWYYDGPTGQFTWSQEMFDIYGLDPANGTPSLETLVDHCHPEDREKLRLHREATWGKDTQIEVRIVRPDGEARYVVAKSTVKLDEAGRVRSRFGTLSDVTETKLAEAVARESEQRYRFLADHAPDMISRVTPTGTILYVSPSSVRVFGHTPEEMMNQKPAEMTHPDDIGLVQAEIARMGRDRLRRLERPMCYRAKHKDGRWIWIQSDPIQTFDEHGEPVEFIDIVRDVTAEKEAEEELEHAKRRAEAAAAAKASFLANMSHELRTPLTSIIGFSRLLQTRGDLPGEAAHYAARINDASEGLLTIINDILDFSKLEAGQAQLEIRPFSPTDLVEDTIDLIAVQAKAKGLKLQQDLDPATPGWIMGDVARLRQVMLNLLSNAVKFTDVGSVTVSLCYRPTDGGWLRVAVADTGRGMAEDGVARLFERFSQAETSINRTHGGTGLGLAICKAIVELMGGRIGVDSAVGAGSTFWFEIPAEAVEGERAEASEPSPELVCELPPVRLLMVDDTAVNRELVRLMLEPLGVSMEEAASGTEGVAAAMARPFDLILMDVRMPGVDGLEATRVIRAHSPMNARTPILALTADVLPENLAACRAAGMDALIGKPISPKELVGSVVAWTSGAERDEEPASAVA